MDGWIYSSLCPHSGFVKDVARPDYWVPDQNIIQCHQCSKTFTAAMSKHHCRACGQGVCGPCSTHIKPVPSRGWDHPVRVCDGCFARSDTNWSVSVRWLTATCRNQHCSSLKPGGTDLPELELLSFCGTLQAAQMGKTLPSLVVSSAFN